MPTFTDIALMFSILGIFACAMTAIYIIWVGVLPHFGHICSKCKNYHNNNGMHECHTTISYCLKDIPMNIPCTDKEISEKFNNLTEKTDLDTIIYKSSEISEKINHYLII